MQRKLSCTAAAACLLALTGGAPAQSGDEDARKAAAVIARSKTASATYAAYFWNWIERPGEAPAQEWSAEFNAGNLHRVETSQVRAIADCVGLTGAYSSGEFKQIFRTPAAAGAACGIDTNRPILQTEYLGRVTTRFGGADRVRVTDVEMIRTYDISVDGVILHTTYVTNDARKLTVVRQEAVAVLDTLPDPAIFDEPSLTKSYVPDRFKSPPR